ncbi:MAG: hypothetical protein K0R00_3377 [Herbinix sp.]|nr:hypothetical protein [Herbinix sp.]
MLKKEFLDLTKSKIVILDGSTGRNLQQRGMPVGVCPEQWILENPEVLIGLQREFLEAGSDIILAPTFTANRLKLAEYGLEERIEEINKKLVALSKEAVNQYQAISKSGRRVYVAADLSMTGEQVQPLGKISFEELVDIYKEQLKYQLEAGIDLIFIETMMSLQETRAALLAAKEVCDLPVMVSFTFEKNGRTLYGTDPKTAVIVMQSMGADAIGVNCSTGPDKMQSIVREMKAYANIPIIAKPKMAELIKAGANIVGGCCGTTVEHIRQMVDKVADLHQIPARNTHVRALTTEQNTVEIPLDGRFLVVGERINPTGKKAHGRRTSSTGSGHS